MKQNSTYSPPYMLTLTFGELAAMRYLYAALTFTGYTFGILFNCCVVSVVALRKKLHEPMYVFVAALCVNGLYGSTGFYPGLFVHLLSETHTLSYSTCMAQVFVIHTYVGCEMSLLTVMAYDRYVCICNPLRYHNVIPVPVAFKMVVGAWIYSIVLISTHIALTLRLPLCGSVILKINCDNWSVVRLSCVDVTVNNIFGLFISATFIGAMPMFIMFSYLCILRACTKLSKDFRTKALQTCTPHLICIANFVANLFLDLLVYRVMPTSLPFEVRTFLAVQIMVVPPLLNPLIYGLKMKEFRMEILQRVHRNKMLVRGLSV